MPRLTRHFHPVPPIFARAIAALAGRRGERAASVRGETIGKLPWQRRIRRAERVEYVPEISRTPGIVTNRRNHRERRPAAHGPPTPHGRRRGRYKPCEAMRRRAPFSMVSTVRDDPRRCGYLRDTLYTLRVTKKILARLRTAKSISRDLDARIEDARSREIELAVPGQAGV